MVPTVISPRFFPKFSSFRLKLFQQLISHLIFFPIHSTDPRRYHSSGNIPHQPNGILQRIWVNWCVTQWIHSDEQPVALNYGQAVHYHRQHFSNSMQKKAQHLEPIKKSQTRPNIPVSSNISIDFVWWWSFLIIFKMKHVWKCDRICVDSIVIIIFMLYFYTHRFYTVFQSAQMKMIQSKNKIKTNDENRCRILNVISIPNHVEWNW